MGTASSKSGDQTSRPKTAKNNKNTTKTTRTTVPPAPQTFQPIPNSNFYTNQNYINPNQNPNQYPTANYNNTQPINPQPINQPNTINNNNQNPYLGQNVPQTQYPQNYNSYQQNPVIPPAIPTPPQIRNPLNDPNKRFQNELTDPRQQQPIRPAPVKPEPINQVLQNQRKTAMQRSPIWGELNESATRKPAYDVQKWRALITRLQENLKLINYVYSRPRRTFKSINELGVFFRNSPAESEIELAWIIYVWISQNIDYDVDSFRTGIFNDIDLEPEGVLEYGKTISWGYAKLFEALCKANELECISISGFAKGLSYRQNHAFIDPNHEWNAVKLNGVWQLVDCTWGTGYVSDDFVFFRKFVPYYFLTPPQIFIYDHYSEQYQLQPQKMSVRRFEKLPLLKLEFFLNEVKCLSHDIYTSIRPIDRNFKMEFSCAEDSVLLASLEKTNGDMIEGAVVVQYDPAKNFFEFLMTLPNGRDSVLNIFTRKNGEESQFCGEVYIFAPVNLEASVLTVNQPEYESDSSESEFEEIIHYPVQIQKPKPKMIFVQPIEEEPPKPEYNFDLEDHGLYEIHVPPDYDIRVKDKYDYYIKDRSGRTTKLMALNENDL